MKTKSMEEEYMDFLYDVSIYFFIITSLLAMIVTIVRATGVSL